MLNFWRALKTMILTFIWIDRLFSQLMACIAELHFPSFSDGAKAVKYKHETAPILFWPKSHERTSHHGSDFEKQEPSGFRSAGQCESFGFIWWMQNTSPQWSLSPGLSSLEHSCSTLTPDELLIGHEMRSPARSHDPSERLLRSCSSALYVTDGDVLSSWRVVLLYLLQYKKLILYDTIIIILWISRLHFCLKEEKIQWLNDAHLMIIFY